MSTDDRAFLGHPKGLGYLSFTEAFERFSYYGMQALLVLYMVKYLLLPGNFERVWLLKPLQSLLGGLEGQPLASAIFGLYASLVYLTPIAGGMIADRWLGKRLTVLAGAITMAVGHFLMAFEPAFLLAQLCLIVGTGLFKGNIASQVGALYGPEDNRRADAFQIFYLGINAGVIAAPLIVGTLGETKGWHWGFGAAGIGMVIGLAIYVAGQKYLGPEPARVKGAARPKLTPTEWRQTLGLLMLIPVLAIAVVPNQQIFNAYLLWGDGAFDLQFRGTQLPTTWLITLDAIVSVSFLAGVALFWRWWAINHKEPDEVGKLLIGSLFSFAGMMALVAAAVQGESGKIGLALPVLFHVLNSIGFAHMMPVSLALFARRAPASLNSTVIGLYYLCLVGGNALVGWIGGLFSTMSPVSFWLMHAGFAVVGGVGFLLFRLLVWNRGGAGKGLPEAIPAP
ncbi:peptide MFS transporter [Sandaracinobacter neustonicus]|uniref:peptide MFS transporter n=1 Tax=Sandaracinobacter neustonicus TaxID=1715348 RepID=UPI001F1D6C59|nr:peptide MFS transporter [Sandaracinobacter neustonicus]